MVNPEDYLVIRLLYGKASLGAFYQYLVPILLQVNDNRTALVDSVEEGDISPQKNVLDARVLCCAAFI